MKAIAAIRKNDYRRLAAIVFGIAVVTGILMERLLYRFSADSANTIVSGYGASVIGANLNRTELMWYLLKTDLKQYLFQVFLSFSALGLFGNLMFFYLTVYRYIFLMAAIYRSDVSSGYILCICFVLICFLLCVPTFLYCIRLSCNSYLYCKENHTKLYHCTKYQLQTELKIGIIMLVYTAFGAVVESVICTGLFERIFV